MKKTNSGLLRLIAIFKLVKAVTLIGVGFGALHLLQDGNALDSILDFLAKIGLNPGGHYVDLGLARLANVPPKDFKDLGIGSFIYAALFLIEGTGLWLEKRWAEYFTTIITASLVPLEIFEIHHHPTVAKVVILLINLAVVGYLIVRIRTDRSEPKSA